MQSGESAGRLLEISWLLAVEMVKLACGRKVSEKGGSVLVIFLVRRVLQRNMDACVLRAGSSSLLLVYRYPTNVQGEY